MSPANRSGSGDFRVLGAVAFGNGVCAAPARIPRQSDVMCLPVDVIAIRTAAPRFCGTLRPGTPPSRRGSYPGPLPPDLARRSRPSLSGTGFGAAGQRRAPDQTRRGCTRPATGCMTTGGMATARRACKPDPVRGRARPLDGHSSGRRIAPALTLPTRTSRAGAALRRGAPHEVPIRHCSRWGLPCGSRRREPGGLLPHRFTLTRARRGRSVFCGAFRRISPPGRYPAPSLPGVRTFLGVSDAATIRPSAHAGYGRRGAPGQCRAQDPCKDLGSALPRRFAGVTARAQASARRGPRRGRDPRPRPVPRPRAAGAAGPRPAPPPPDPPPRRARASPPARRPA